jgi:hypothetical protein
VQDVELTTDAADPTGPCGKPQSSSAATSPPAAAAAAAGGGGASAVLSGLPWLDRLLPVWIIAAMVLGVILGSFAPQVRLAGAVPAEPA